VIISVERATDTAEARRRAATLAQQAGFDADHASRVAIVATELATNIVKHTDRGELIAQRYRIDAATSGVELIALDAGPGIADLARARADGFSTAGSPGTGLGAIARLADLVSVYTRPGQGTVMLTRLAPPRGRDAGAPAAGFEIAAIAAPCPGEIECGDAWAAAPVRDRRCRLMVVDGSGHGAPAAVAARAATAQFEAKPGLGPVELITEMHRALGHTRGAAAGVAEIDRDAGLVRFAGLGNIAATVIRPDGRHGLVSSGGTLGHTWRTVREYSDPIAVTATIILHSDGIATRWQLDSYPGLEVCHAGVIAAVLYRDFRRGHDDATVLVAKAGPEASP
jgi:anti-sigma regulatory factor (Ser/Thr protein kinase)